MTVRRARPMTPERAAIEMRKGQQSIEEWEQMIAKEKESVRYYQRFIWRTEQKLDQSVTNDEIDGDALFHIRFPDHKTV